MCFLFWKKQYKDFKTRENEPFNQTRNRLITYFIKERKLTLSEADHATQLYFQGYSLNKAQKNATANPDL
jgi:hypothetical protein